MQNIIGNVYNIILGFNQLLLIDPSHFGEGFAVIPEIETPQYLGASLGSVITVSIFSVLMSITNYSLKGNEFDIYADISPALKREQFLNGS
jgi:hypothetical protein